ncbi:MAG: cob(I)yrinic acid a,c-diamide adenosyltransferase, partial [SAR324 cluster bacterium]|nr:cob(I)yrinic acid a,c-diamide adenosyltransferase [SAR324 cluster bacterium]
LHLRVASGDYDLVIVDEINYCLHRGLVDLDQVLRVVGHRPPQVELVFTGRYAHEELVERADLVTEMRKVKHHFEQGVRARVGIEF